MQTEMGHCQTESKKQSNGSSFDLYGGVFNSKIFGSKGNLDRSTAWSRYNAGSYTPAAAYMKQDTFSKEIAADRGHLYGASFREDKNKNMGSPGKVEGLESVSSKGDGGDHSTGKGSNGGIENRAGSMNGGESVSLVPYNGVGMRADNILESKLAGAPNLGSPLRSSTISGGTVLGRKSSDASSSSSTGSAAGSAKAGGGSPGGGSPIVGSLKVGGGNHSYSGELSVGSTSSGGSSSGGSPTAESVRRSGRSLRVGNILNPKTSGSPTGDNKEKASNIIGCMLTGGGLGNVKRPGHSRANSHDGPPALTKSGSSSRSSGELSSGATINSRPTSGPQISSGNLYTGNIGASTSKAANGSSNANASHGGHLANGNMYSGGSLSNGSNLANGNVNHSNGPLFPNGNILSNGNILPNGNILNSGKIPSNGNGNVLNSGITGKGDGAHVHILGSGNANYGHGNIMKGNGKSDSKLTGNIQFAGECILLKRAMSSTDPEDVKNAGNDQYKKGHFAEALSLYDRAISLSPGHAPYRSNRAAALTGLGRLAEAVLECQAAIRLDPSYARAHQRLASLYLKLGQVENARRHFGLSGQQSDWGDIQRVQNVEKHLTKCTEARRIGDWRSVLRESDAAVVAGAESAPQLFASKAEALLKLHRLDEADAVLMNAQKIEVSNIISPRIFGIAGDSYVLLVRAQVDMALGRFEGAVAAAENATRMDPGNRDVSSLLRKARAVAHSRSTGNELFKAGKFLEACAAYGEGLEYDPMNAVLLCNRAACRSKLGQWEKSLEDCNRALSIQPNYIKALHRRAASNAKLERWEESARDYETVRMEVPGDVEVARSLFYVQVALKKSRGEEIYNMKFGGEVEVVSNSDQFREAISSPGLAVVHFNARSSEQCKQISPFIDQLCGKYPAVNFLKVDVEENHNLAKVESVNFVPTFKFYKNGVKVKEILCPSQQVLENSVKHYNSL